MNRRDEQIAEVLRRTAHLDQHRLALFHDWVRDAYRASTSVDRMAIVHEIEDRSPSNFHVLTNQETRRLDHFNGPTYSWEMYCKELGRSVALGEQTYLFAAIQEAVPDVDVSTGVGFSGLHEVIGSLQAIGYQPDFILAPISYMVSFYGEQRSMEWDGSGRAYFLSQGTRLEMRWSANGRPLDRFIVFDHRGGTWHVKLDPHRNGGRLTVAIGEQLSPPGVTWLAETVAFYEVTDPNAFRSFRPDVPIDSTFDTLR